MKVEIKNIEYKGIVLNDIKLDLTVDEFNTIKNNIDIPLDKKEIKEDISEVINTNHIYGRIVIFCTPTSEYRFTPMMRDIYYLDFWRLKNGNVGLVLNSNSHGRYGRSYTYIECEEYSGEDLPSDALIFDIVENKTSATYVLDPSKIKTENINNFHYYMGYFNREYRNFALKSKLMNGTNNNDGYSNIVIPEKYIKISNDTYNLEG